MEPDNFIKEGYVEQKFDEKTQEKWLGISPIGAIALGLLEVLEDSNGLPRIPYDVRKSTPIEELEHVGKKLVKDGYVEHRVNRETKEEQVCISVKGKELLLALSFFAKIK